MNINRSEAVRDIVETMRRTQGERYTSQVLTLQNISVLGTLTGCTPSTIGLMFHNAMLAFGYETDDVVIIERLRRDVRSLNLQMGK